VLESECRAAGVQTFLQNHIREVQRTTEFVVHSESGEFRAPELVVATGGLSIRRWARRRSVMSWLCQFRLKIVETKPALVPFVVSDKDRGPLLRLGRRFSRSRRKVQSSCLPRKTCYPPIAV